MKTIMCIALVCALSTPFFAQEVFSGRIDFSSTIEFKSPESARKYEGMGDITIMKLSDGKRGLVKTMSSAYGFFIPETMAGRIFHLDSLQEAHFKTGLNMNKWSKCYLDAQNDSIKILNCGQTCLDSLACYKNYVVGDEDEDLEDFPSDKKTILGYQCNKAIATNELGDKTTIYYTKQLPAFPTKDKGLKHVKGQILYYEVVTADYIQRVEATTVKAFSPPKSAFQLPRFSWLDVKNFERH